MVKAGIIPFVRSEGGQVEIVGEKNQALFFSNEQEAVEKIITVLSNAEQQKQLWNSLAEQQHLFSADRFMAEMNKVVETYFTST